MRKLVLLLLAVAGFYAAAAQDSVVDYRARYQQLYDQYVEEPTNVATQLFLADFFRDPANPLFDYVSAMNYINGAERRYLSIVNERSAYKEVSRLMKQKVTVARVREVKHQIIDSASAWLYRGPDLSPSQLDSWVKAFEGIPTIQRQLASKRLQMLYRQTCEAHSLDAYLQFVKSYPGTAESEQCEAAMGTLAASLVAPIEREGRVDTLLAPYSEVASVRRAAMRRKSAIAYARMQLHPSSQAYRDFLTRYPGSDEYMLVMGQMDAVLVQEFNGLTTPRQYADFAQNHPDNPLAEEAVSRIKHMILDDHDARALDIYLREFPLDVSYNDIYLDYFNRHAAEGNASPLLSFAKNHPDFPHTMSLNDALREARRIDSIDITTPFNEKDFRAWASKVYHLTGKDVSFVGLQRTLQQFIASEAWDRVADRVNFFSLCFEDRCVEQVAELMATVKAPVRPEMRLNHVVCPAYDMVHPVLYPGEQLLFYDRLSEGASVIWMARPTPGRKGTVWRGTGAVRFANIENKGLHVFSFSGGGRQMLLGRDGDILVAELRDSVWYVTETLPEPVNSRWTDYDAYLLPDGSGILFASDRPGGHNLQPSGSYFHGDHALASDLWFVARRDGMWDSVAVNLGRHVNSPYMECSPLLSADKRTLYFVTDGRGGLGYGDIYYATRDNVDDWSHWSVPQNFGKEVNSGFRESSVTFAEEGRKLTVCTNRGGHFGCYSVSAAVDASESLAAVAVVAPQVAVSISVCDYASGRYILKGQALERSSEELQNRIPLTLHADRQYLLQAFCPGVFLPGLLVSPATQSEVVLEAYDASAFFSVAAQKGELPLPALHFEEGQSSLTPMAYAELDHLADFLRRHSELMVELAIHVGGNSDAASFALSQSRGDVIKNYLVSKGVDADHVVLSPYGNSQVKRGRAATSVWMIPHAF